MLKPLHIKNYNFWMLPIEGGTFDMGDESGDLGEGYRPVHQVQVSSFYLAKYPVTQALWKMVMADMPAHFTGDQRPVERVSWGDARIFIEKLRTATRQPFRLPTEAEWEFAVRGGIYKQNHAYAGSNRLKEVAWFGANSHGETKSPGLKFRNELGLYDMSGNVWEWCEDWYGGSKYYQECHEKGLVVNPVSPNRGSHRVYRGGSWLDTPKFCRNAWRNSWHKDTRNFNLGFRLALSLQLTDRPDGYL